MTLVSSRRHISELMVLCFGRPMQLLRGFVSFVGWLFMCVIVFRHVDSAIMSGGYCEVMVVRICCSIHNFMFGVYRNPDLSDKVSDSWLTTMAKVQSVDRKESFWFVGNLNTYHKEWLGSFMTLHHRVVSRWLLSLHTLMEGCLTWC